MRKISILLALALSAVPLWAQELPSKKDAADGKYRLKDLSPSRDLRPDFGGWDAFPLDRPYWRFTDKEKKAARDLYEGMPENDEPPFPIHGLGAILTKFARIVSGTELSGTVNVYALVDAKGEVREVSVLQAASPELAKILVVTVMDTRFKPAICSGKPCSMEFPVRVNYIK